MRSPNKKSNDKPIPGYRSLFDEEESSFIEDFKDRSNKWISMELERMNKAFVDNAPDSRSLINRAQLGALVTISRDRQMFHLKYHDQLEAIAQTLLEKDMLNRDKDDVTGNVTGDLPNSEQAGGDVVI